MSKVKVTIEAKQVIHFNQEVEMDIEDFEKVKHLEMDDVGDWRKEDREAYDVLESYINFSDVFDSNHEFTDVYVNAVSDK